MMPLHLASATRAPGKSTNLMNSQSHSIMQPVPQRLTEATPNLILVAEQTFPVPEVSRCRPNRTAAYSANHPRRAMSWRVSPHYSGANWCLRRGTLACREAPKIATSPSSRRPRYKGDCVGQACEYRRIGQKRPLARPNGKYRRTNSRQETSKSDTSDNNNLQQTAGPPDAKSTKPASLWSPAIGGGL